MGDEYPGERSYRKGNDAEMNHQISPVELDLLIRGYRLDSQSQTEDALRAFQETVDTSLLYKTFKGRKSTKNSDRRVSTFH